MRYLRAFKYLLLIMAVGAALAFVERRSNADHHLAERMHARSQPQLSGASQQELAQVLIELYPEGARPNILMGTTLAEQGKWLKARVHLEKALAADRHSQQLLFAYAQLLLDMGEDTAKVQEIVDELRQLFPRSRQTVETYFTQASKGKLKFDEGVY